MFMTPTKLEFALVLPVPANIVGLVSLCYSCFLYFKVLVTFECRILPVHHKLDYCR